MFAKTPVYDVDGLLVFGLMREVVVPDPSDTLEVVRSGEEDRLDLLSARFYGNPSLFWMLASVNGLLDPEIGFSVNQQIRVPTKSRLAALGILNV